MKAYTTKSNALRAAKSAGFTKEQVEICNYEGGFTWIEVAQAPAPAPVELKDVTVAMIGSPVVGDVHDYHCPHCHIHLSNGVGTHEGEVNGKHVVFTKEFEYWCMACEGEFGPAIAKAKTKPAKAESAKVEIKNESTTDRPCKSVWAIADSMPGARRKEVLAACVEKGIAYNTARTQYQQWFQLNKKG